MKERFKIIPAVYLVLEKEKKVLLSRRSNTGHEDGNYSLVSGHLKGDESLKDAMIREAKEEIGIILSADKLKIVHITHKRKMIGDDGERMDIFFYADEWEGEIKNAEPDKCDDLKWFSQEKLPKNLVSYVKHALEQIDKNEFYSEIGF